MTKELTATWASLCIDLLEEMPESDTRRVFVNRYFELMKTCNHLIKEEEKETV
jgi:hypothetical protein